MDWAGDPGYLAVGATDLRKGYEGLFKDEVLILESIASSFTPPIPKELFDKWARDPYGQEQIDSYLKNHGQDK
jgi:hypothetical protein